MIRQREQEALTRVKNNPIQMAMIRKSVSSPSITHTSKLLVDVNPSLVLHISETLTCQKYFFVIIDNIVITLTIVVFFLFFFLKQALLELYIIMNAKFQSYIDMGNILFY